MWRASCLGRVSDPPPFPSPPPSLAPSPRSSPHPSFSLPSPISSPLPSPTLSPLPLSCLVSSPLSYLVSSPLFLAPLPSLGFPHSLISPSYSCPPTPSRISPSLSRIPSLYYISLRTLSPSLVLLLLLCLSSLSHSPRFIISLSLCPIVPSPFPMSLSIDCVHLLPCPLPYPLLCPHPSPIV